MLERKFGSLGNFIKKRYKIIIVVWIIVLVILLPFTAMSTSVTNYNVEMTGVSKNSMSNEAQNLMDSQFNSSENSSNQTVVVLFVNSSFYSTSSYDVWKTINSTYKNDLNGTGVIGIISPYMIANSVIDSVSGITYDVYEEILNASNVTVSSFRTFNSSVNGIENFSSDLRTIDLYYNSTYYNISGAVNNYSSLFLTYKNLVSGVSDLTYGIPLEYFSTYEELPSNITGAERDAVARNTLLNETGNFGGNTTILSFFDLFYSQWNSSGNQNLTGSVYDRLNSSIDAAFSLFNTSLSESQQLIFDPVFSSFNVTSYSDNATRSNITLQLVYAMTSSYGAASMQLFNATYYNFVAGGNETLLSENLTGDFLNSSDPSISQFTTQMFNLTPEQFSAYFILPISINNEFIEKQINQSVLSSSIEELYSSIGMPSSVFYSSLLNNSTAGIIQYFVDFAALNINPLSSALDQNSSYMVSYFLSEGAQKSSLHFSETFLQNRFSGYPYFHFENVESFVSTSVESKGNLSSTLQGNYTDSGLFFNSSLFQTLVPGDFSGFMIILTFNESNLNGNQLNILNSYISNVQNKSDPVQIYYTSGDEIAHGIESAAYTGLFYSLIIGIIISIIIVGVYFRSPLLAFVPLLFFGIAFSITMGIVELIFGIIEKSSLSFIVTTLSSILILGLSTDYSVYILNRYVKEKSKDKFGSTVEWAGHAVFTSGITVIISYVVLALFDVPIIGDGGFVNALGISISVGVALTLLPSFMFLFQKRIKPRKRIVNFERVANVSRKHRKALVACLIIIFVATLVVYETTPTSFDLFSLIPDNQGKTGYYEMVSAYGGDFLSPNYVLLTFSNQIYLNGHFNELDIGILNHIAKSLLNYSAVSQVQTITYPFGELVSPGNLSGSSLSINTTLNQSLSFIGTNGKTVLINIYTKYVSFNQSGLVTISHIDSIIKSAVPSTVQYLVGGAAQGLIESSQSINLSTYRIVEILAAIVFAVLAFQLTSIFTPLRLLFNVGTSALLAVTLFYVVFHYIMHLPIIVFGPLFVIVTLFGVGLDYDIFLVTRTREAVMKGKSDEEAIGEAIKENASVVLVLGFILSGVFGSLIFSPIDIISEIGFSVTVGVLIDTVISWLFLIPALMLVLRKYNWWPSHIRGRS